LRGEPAAEKQQGPRDAALLTWCAAGAA